MAGVKYDEGKVPLNLLDADFLFGTASVLEFGAKKYAPYNWAEGMAWSRVFGALMRHMWKWWRGEEVDEETGISHLYHASCCLMFLSHYQAYGVGEDDRYKNKNKKETNAAEEPIVRFATLPTVHRSEPEYEVAYTIPNYVSGHTIRQYGPTYPEGTRANTVESCRISDLPTHLQPTDADTYIGSSGPYDLYRNTDGAIWRYDPTGNRSVSEPTVGGLFRARGSTFNSLYDLTEGDGSGTLPVATGDRDS